MSEPNTTSQYDPTPELSLMAKVFQPGIYEHYKGDLYKAFFVGRLSEARDQEFVVYESLSKGLIWIRPLGMFLESVEYGKYKGPRFRWVREEK
jgi:hypothetical protein